MTIVAPSAVSLWRKPSAAFRKTLDNASAGALPFLLLDRLASAFGYARRQRRMRKELLLAWEAAQVGTIFAEDHFPGLHADGIDWGGIHTAHSLQGWSHRLLAPTLNPSRRVRIFQRWCRALARLRWGHLGQLALDLFFVGFDPLLHRIVPLQRLLQTEPGVLPPVPAQRFGDLFLALTTV